MVRLKFIIKQNALALRISEGKERNYRQVRHLLVGVPDLKFWDADKERFYPSLHCLCGEQQSTGRVQGDLSTSNR